MKIFNITKRYLSIILVIIAVSILLLPIISYAQYASIQDKLQNNSTYINPVDFDVMTYIADLYIKIGSEEIEIVNRFSILPTATSNRAYYLEHDPVFKAQYAEWWLTAWGSDDIAIKLSKKDLYEGMILALLQKVSDSGVQTVSVATSFNQIIDEAIENFNDTNMVTREILENSSQNAQNLLTYVENRLEHDFIGSLPSEIKATIKATDKVADVLNKYAQYQQFYYASENIKNILTQLHTAAFSKMQESSGMWQDLDTNYRNGSDLVEALDEILRMCNEQLTPGNFVESLLDGSDWAVKGGSWFVSKTLRFIAEPVIDAFNLFNKGLELVFSNNSRIDNATHLIHYAMIEELMQGVVRNYFDVYKNNKSRDNAERLIYAVDFMHATIQNGYDYLYKDWDIIYRTNFYNSFEQDIVEEAKQQMYYVNEKRQEYRQLYDLLKTNWQKTLKKQYPNVYNYLFDIPNITDPRGDDGDVNWNFIVPVRHRKEVPPGWTGIYTVTDLDNMRNDLDGRFILMNDIDLSGWGNWTPIGDGSFTDAEINNEEGFEEKKHLRGFGYFTYEENIGRIFQDPFPYVNNVKYDPSIDYVIQNRFTGYFQGNGYTIKNLKIINDDYYTNFAGLFGYIDVPQNISLRSNTGIELPRIADLSLEDMVINISTPNIDLMLLNYNGIFVGGIAGFLYDNSYITNCYTLEGEIKTQCIGISTVGGLVGSIRYSPDLWIKDCYNTADIVAEASSSAYAGGIVGGLSTINMVNCFNIGDINIFGQKETTNIGYLESGIAVGIGFLYNRNCNIKKCANYGKISAKGQAVAATGMFGQYVENSYNQGEIYAYGEVKQPEFYDSYNKYGIGYSTGIGLFTHLYGYNNIDSSYNIGNVHSLDESWFYRDQTYIYNVSRNFDSLPIISYSTLGIFHLSEQNYVLNNHIWSKEQWPEIYYPDGPPLEILGTVLSSAEFIQKSSFSSFDFDTIWDINPEINKGRPFLRNQIPAWRENTVTPKIPDCAEGRHFITAIPLKLNSIVEATCDQNIFKFIPETTGYYIFESVFAQKLNNVIWNIYDTYENTFKDEYGYSYGYTYGEHFQRRVLLTAGNMYYFTILNLENALDINLRYDNMQLSDTEAVSADKKSLIWDLIKGSNITQNKITTNLATLPTTGTNGSIITWTSSNSAVSDTGIVTRPSIGASNAIGTLTATLVKGNASAIMTFEFTVLELGVEIVPGDVNNDGQVNIQDVLMIYQYTRGKILLSPDQMLAADVNGDGSVTMPDVLLVYQFYRGKISAL